MSAINITTPHTLMQKQKQFIQSDKRYTLYSGGVGSGKTIAGCYKALYLALSIPKSRGLIGTQTYTHLTVTVMFEFNKIIDAIGWHIIKYHNKTEKNIYL